MNCEPETPLQILAKLLNPRRDEPAAPAWPKHYAPMPPGTHGWWLRAKLPFHRDCAACLRCPGGPADPNRAQA